MSTIFNKIVNKCDKVRAEDFTEEQINLINNGYNFYVVIARDNFLSGWGEAENKSCWQVVICWNALQRDKVLSTFKTDHSFKYARDFEDFKNFLNRKFVKSLLTLKNANQCHAWNGGVFV